MSHVFVLMSEREYDEACGVESPLKSNVCTRFARAHPEAKFSGRIVIIPVPFERLVNTYFPFSSVTPV